MDIKELNEKRLLKKMSYEDIAEFTGIKQEDVKPILLEQTKEYSYEGLLAMEQAILSGDRMPFAYNAIEHRPVMIREEPYRYYAREYTEEDWKRISEHTRAELIHGRLYMMGQPSRMHQWIVSELMYLIKDYIRKHKGKCKVYSAPFGVRLFQDDSVIVEPDISMICSEDILTDKGCEGAPDWVIEVVSVSNSSYDYNTKLEQYQKAGVRECWIIDPFRRTVLMWLRDCSEKSGYYSYDKKVEAWCLDGFHVRMAEIEETF